MQRSPRNETVLDPHGRRAGPLNQVLGGKASRTLNIVFISFLIGVTVCSSCTPPDRSAIPNADDAENKAQHEPPDESQPARGNSPLFEVHSRRTDPLVIEAIAVPDAKTIELHVKNRTDRDVTSYSFSMGFSHQCAGFDHIGWLVLGSNGQSLTDADPGGQSGAIGPAAVDVLRIDRKQYDAYSKCRDSDSLSISAKPQLMLTLVVYSNGDRYEP